jgi:hypothetical protein
MKRLLVICLACGLVAFSCAKPAEPPAEIVAAEETVQESEWLETSPEMFTDTQRAQSELVAAATNAMFSELMGELMAALDSGDPGIAIGVCKDKAPEVGAKVAEQYGVQLGRTSHKLRNPANTAPEWADEYISDMVDTPVYLVGPAGELGVMLPIKLKAECQMCHGPQEMIDESVLAAVSEVYPEDQAVGFVEDDLRGWMWVEAPPGGEVAEAEAAEGA